MGINRSDDSNHIAVLRTPDELKVLVQFNIGCLSLFFSWLISFRVIRYTGHLVVRVDL
jgi:hypothetical protein